MKSLALLTAVLGVVAIGCGSYGSSSMTNPSGQTTNTTFNVPLSAANEVPAVTNADAGVTGTATITLHAVKDSHGYVTSATADFQVNASGFTAGGPNMAHIHPGASGQTGGPLVSTGIGSAQPVSNGSVSFTQNGVNVPADQAQAILANPAAYYFNIHTTMNPDGAARGQLTNGAAGDPLPDPGPGY